MILKTNNWSAVRTAIGVAAGIFLVIGALLMFSGWWGITHSGGGSYDAQAQIETAAVSGYGMTSDEQDLTRQAGIIEDGIQKNEAYRILDFGLVLCAPFMIVLITGTIRKRTTNQSSKAS